MGVREARSLLEAGVIRGFKFHPTVQGFFPNDRMAYPLYEVIAEHKLPAIFHSGHSGIGTGMPGGGGLRLKYSNPIHLDDVAVDFPDIQASARLGELGEVNLGHLSANVMARHKVLYAGHAVAAVAATSAHAAAEAILRIRVQYEPLPPVLDVLEAMKPDAPLLHDDIYTDTSGEKADRPSNVAYWPVADFRSARRHVRFRKTSQR